MQNSVLIADVSNNINNKRSRDKTIETRLSLITNNKPRATLRHEIVIEYYFISS